MALSISGEKVVCGAYHTLSLSPPPLYDLSCVIMRNLRCQFSTLVCINVATHPLRVYKHVTVSMFSVSLSVREHVRTCACLLLGVLSLTGL